MDARKLKRGSLARATGISPNIVYNFLSGKSSYLSQPTLERIAQTYSVPISAITGESLGEQKRSIARGLGEPAGSFGNSAGQGAGLPVELVTVPVSGSVLSTPIWSETIFLDPEKDEFVSFNLPQLYSGKIFAVRLVGASMDQLLPPGAILGCVAVKDYLQQIRPGDIVVMVRRNESGLFQATIKQYAVEGAAHYLAARSSDQRYAEKAELQAPLDSPAALGHQDFFIHAVVLAYVADLPAMRR